VITLWFCNVWKGLAPSKEGWIEGGIMIGEGEIHGLSYDYIKGFVMIKVVIWLFFNRYGFKSFVHLHPSS
jgi:hypothetical protein